MLIKKLKAVRGAVSAENTVENINSAVVLLYAEIIKKNQIKENDIVSIQFTVTKDLTVMNPASALRKSGYALKTPLFCSLEPDIEGLLPGVVRILIHYYGKKRAVPVYLGQAKKLRPDLIF